MDWLIFSFMASGSMAMIMHYLILWATSQIMGLSAKRIRILLGAFAATSFYLPILGLVYFGIIEITSLIAVTIALFSMFVSPLVSFGLLPPRRYLVCLGYIYLITMVAGGVGIEVFVLTRGKMLPTIIAAAGTVLAIAELGWGIVHKRVRMGLFFVPIEITFGDKRIRVDALIDTGNQLRDPITGSPVIILEYSAVAPVLPDEVRRCFQAMEKGDLGAISELMLASSWCQRFRVIPFSSIGQEKGMLIGFRPDEVRILEGKQGLTTNRVVIGVHNRQLSPEGAYRALLHPEILRSAS